MAKKKITKVKRKSGSATKSKKQLPKIKEPLSTINTIIIASILAIVSILVYSPSHNYEFVYDDDAVIKDNLYVKNGFGGLKDIWTTGYFRGYNDNIDARAYRPVPLSTLAIEFDLFDPKEKNNNGAVEPKPHIYHKTNLVYYGLTSFFLFLFLAKLLRNFHPILPIMISLIFLLHPIHLEVVANIKSRDTILGFLNFAIAGWIFLKYLDERKIWQLLLSLFFYFIALFSKEEIITTLAVIPLMMYFFRNFKIKEIGKLTLPFFCAIVFYLIIRTMVITGGNLANANSFMDYINPGLTLTELDNSLLAAESNGEKTASRVLALGHYLTKTVYPHPLLSDYSFSTIPIVNWNDWRVYLSLLAYGILIFFGFKGLKERKFYGFAILYYFIGISIFSNLITTNVSVYNDRFLFNGVLGICALAAFGLYYLMKIDKEGKFEHINWIDFAKKNVLPLSMLIAILVGSIIKIESHLPVWKDRISLFSHDAVLSPNNARMRKNNGGSWALLAVENQTNDIAKAREYAAYAVTELKAALALYEKMETGHIHLGNMYIILGQYPEAEDAFERALEIFPRGHFSKTSLANVYYRQGKYQEAVDLLEGMPKTYFKQSDYNLLYLSYNRLGLGNEAEKYRKLAGK